MAVHVCVRAGDDGASASVWLRDGVYSSRKLKRRPTTMWRFAIFARTRIRMHDTLAEFRKRHLEALAVCSRSVAAVREGGPGEAGHVSSTGTKIKANASKHKAMSTGDGAEAG